MFVVQKKIEITKESRNDLIERLNHPSVMFSYPGFIKREVLLNDSLADRDVIVMLVYWREKADYIAWQRSKDHMEMHKAKAASQKPSHVLSKEKEMFTVISEYSAA